MAENLPENLPVDPRELKYLQSLFNERDIYGYLYDIIELYVPDEFKSTLWGLVNNVRFISTSRISETQAIIYKRWISDQIDKILENYPVVDGVDHAFYTILENIEFLLHLAIDRAVDGFERRMQTTQIKQLVMSQELEGAIPVQQRKGGVFKGLFSKMFG
ncbi:hypothetical protein [Archaeoglobus profundus]|uniref:Uncharacterized protein n=1 Tax=Archaeoglobus profundus (strain DSM 5631 / JCM 9629 / NBRC 100127 / Av18) TaxID=572546 RepID=D2RI34_ARCPA|nr:hypothetical protein [Archaeoglobus profundus]ADB57959.1 hypothetical protein Arcpr_0898 [Archaeoglobus profundus DSM 5631]